MKLGGDSRGGGQKFGNQVWQNFDGDRWKDIFQNQIVGRQTSRVDATYDYLVASLTLCTIRKRKAYALDKVLQKLKYICRSGEIAHRLLELQVSGVFQHDIKGKAGGLKKRGCKKRQAWYITPAGLKLALPHLKLRLNV